MPSETVSTTHVEFPRIVSLLPSATEMVCALGMEAHLVGVSHECDFPASVVGRPVMTASRLTTSKSSGVIDRDLRSVLQDAMAVYQVDADELEQVRPDVIVTQDLCEVCAVAYDDVVAAAQSLTNPEVQLVNLHPKVLSDIRQDMLRVGQALGREAEAQAVVADMDARINAVEARAKDARAPDKSGGLGHRPRVLTIEWIDPVMVGGMWMPELVTRAGGEPLVTQAGEYAPTLDSAALAALDPAPDVVLVKPCGFPLRQTIDEGDELRALLRDMPWPAVAKGAVWVADGNAYFNRPGPRIVESLEILAACIHPSVFGDFADRHAAGFRRFELDC
ncbi:MAG: ABC transporter substrate-binding protein [Planctomycetota bacterium]|nr:ABC transporter substrate-binding protein [Planctomycetota bacterium]